MKTVHASLCASAVALVIAVACQSSSETPKPAATQAPEPAVAAPAGAKIQPFLTADRCGQCHSQSPNAIALTTATGDDASPHGTWQATMMANAFRDPYWRAQMAHEIELAPHDKAAIETLCLTCHAPAASHTARLTGAAPPSIETAMRDPLAFDGVNCTVCHRTTSENLGTPASFNGNLAIKGDATIYGPFEKPATGPMRMHTGFTPTFGEHISTSALCGACHTLYTQPSPDAPRFLEQAVYLEWRNSVFSDEHEKTGDSRTCQECHMPDVGSMRIARNPAGFDFATQVRDGVRAHTFVGGNAFMTDMLRVNAAELGVTASESALKRVAAASRALLGHSTATLAVSNVQRRPGGVAFDVKVENLTGHKFPSGYPARRAWLAVEVRSGRNVLFHSGAVGDDGRLKGVADELALPHFDRIERADQVQVYEMLAVDQAGLPTTMLTRMAAHSKDNRLLPRGWKRDGPHADETRPVGTDSDANFTGGSDVVTYDVALPETEGALLIVARLFYQSIPPAWAATLADSKTPEAAQFLKYYAQAVQDPETVAVTVVTVPK
ncbi:MAG: hypothetical protein JNL28_16835 [Planctomycetes bacterium]|nr:hypothetical protein [Planctomycetota bacterium]